MRLHLPGGSPFVLAVAVSLAPFAGSRAKPDGSGIHRWLGLGGLPRFLTVVPIARHGGTEAQLGDAVSFDLTHEAEAARELLRQCSGLVSFTPERDRACLDSVGATPWNIQGSPPWVSLRAMAQWCALPNKLPLLAERLGLECSEDVIAACNKPPEGLGGDGGRGVSAQVARLHANVFATFIAHEGLPSVFERRVERMTLAMNLEGVGVDLNLVRIMAGARDSLVARYKARFRQMTGFNPTQRDKLVAWLNNRGLQVSSLNKAAMRGIKEHIDNSDTDFAEVREALYLYAESTRTALAKLDALQKFADNGRVRGHLIYHGAHTGRWSAEDVQLQNFPRPGLNMGAAVQGLMEAGSLRAVKSLEASAKEVGLQPLQYLQSLLRGLLTDEAGLAWFDFSQIEARILAYLAGEYEMLATFIRSNDGEAEFDIYIEMAALVLGIHVSEVTLDQRNRIGKPAILGCGFGLSEAGAAGHEQFASVEPHLARKAVRDYRRTYPLIPKLWETLARPARLAIAGQGSGTALGGKWRADFERVLVAPKQYRVRIRTQTGDITHSLYFPVKGTDADMKWKAGHALAENLASRIARDCVAHVMLELARQGEVPLHVNHDEPIFRASPTLKASVPGAFRQAEEVFGLPEGTLSFEYATALRYSK